MESEQTYNGNTYMSNILWLFFFYIFCSQRHTLVFVIVVILLSMVILIEQFMLRSLEHMTETDQWTHIVRENK